MDSRHSPQDFTSPTTQPGSRDSPLVGKTSDLSPARPFNVPLRLGLDSPRRQFMSPRVKPHCQRTTFTEPSGAAQDGGCNNILPSVNASGNDQIAHPLAYPGMFLADPTNMDFVPPDDVAGNENVLKLGHESDTGVKVEKAAFAPHSSIYQNPGVSMTEAFHYNDMPRSHLQFEDGQNKFDTKQHSQIRLDDEVASSLSLTRPQTPFNTIQSIPYPKQHLHPTPTMSIPKPSSSGLHQLNTNRHAQIHSDGEGARSLSLTRKQTPFNTIEPVLYPKRFFDISPTMSATVNFKSAQVGSSSMQERMPKSFFKPVAVFILREATDDNNLKSLEFAPLTQSPDKFGVLNPRKDLSTQADKNQRKAENVGNEGEFFRSNPRKGRQAQKQKPESGGGDSCIISCQCKKNKCVKLYCECFAARAYCAETCSCQGCLNVKECDDEVLEARELIESRNPLAFAPKVVQHSIEPSAIGYGEDGTRLSPFSARHIRGCNCKRSMCLKKYCACFQSKVGCSDGCRCEGCQNVYGQKREKGIVMSGEENKQRIDSSFFDSFNTPGPANTCHGTNQITTPNSTLLSPQVLCSDLEEESKIWSFEQYIQSPEFRLPIDENDSFFNIAKETIEPLLSNQEPDFGNAETMDEFEFPIPYHKPEETGTSGVPNYMEWRNSSAPRFPSGCGHCSRAGSENWHHSKVSSLLDFRGNKHNQVDAFEHEFHNILKDDQPETLEDTQMPLNTVKVSTQNKKRVCPPDPVQQLGSTLPVGSLRSVSASLVQQMKDPQDQGGNK